MTVVMQICNSGSRDLCHRLASCMLTSNKNNGTIIKYIIVIWVWSRAMAKSFLGSEMPRIRESKLKGKGKSQIAMQPAYIAVTSAMLRCLCKIYV